MWLSTYCHYTPVIYSLIFHIAAVWVLLTVHKSKNFYWCSRKANIGNHCCLQYSIPISYSHCYVWAHNLWCTHLWIEFTPVWVKMLKCFFKNSTSSYEVCNVFRQFYAMQICTLHLSFMCIAHTDTFTEETVTVIGILQSKRVSTFPDCCQVELYLDRPCHHCVLTLRLKPRRTSKTLKEEMQTLVKAFVLHTAMFPQYQTI